MANDTYTALIENIIAEKCSEIGTADRSEAFEAVVNSLVLDHMDFSVDEIEAGITEGNGDGQIDSMYVIVNSAPISGESDDEIPQKGPLEVEIIAIQSKNTSSFEENVMKIIRSTFSDLMDLGADYGRPRANYNTTLQEKFQFARRALLASAGRTATVRVRVIYASKGTRDNIHPSVLEASTTLKEEISKRCATRDVEIEFFGAEELIAISRRPKTRSRDIEVDQALSSDNGDSFACLVTLESLVRFLSDEKGDLVRGLFDANVRDFMGKTEVNEAIRRALGTMEQEDFWWLNNGITIVASGADQKGKKLALSEPLVVNGLQTSSVVHEFMRDLDISEELKLKRGKNKTLIKIIVPPDETTRDEIIKATNSQTNIPKPYLRGMDLVHRNIEDHLKSCELFYERRKNQYKNMGKSRSSIVTLSELAQSLMAAFLFRSADARGRPNSLLKSDDDYQKLFSEEFPLDSFKNVILSKRKILDYLIETHGSEGAVFRNNVVFHVINYVSASRFFSPAHAASGWAKIALTASDVSADAEAVVSLFKEKGATDQVAKNKVFQDEVVKLAAIARSSR